MKQNRSTRRQFVKGTAASAGALALGGLASTPGAAQALAVVGETGTVTTNQGDPNGFKTVSFEQTFTDAPVVVMSPASFDGAQPCHPRVRDVTTDSFRFQIEEWDYLDGGHVGEQFHYLALQPGVYSVGNNLTKLEAGRISVNDQSVRNSYQQDFDNTPIVLTQSQTYRGNDPIVSRGDVSRTGFDTRLQEEEGKANDGRHVTEEVGYVAFGPGADILDTPLEITNKFEARNTPSNVTDAFYHINFRQAYDANPVFLAATQTEHGPDTTELRYRKLDGDGVNVFCEEEQSADAETNHAPEVVGYLVFNDAGLIYA